MNLLVAWASAATAYHVAAKPVARARRTSMSSDWAGDLSAEVEAAVATLESASSVMDFSVPLYGDGQAALHIAHTLRTWLNR